MLPGFWQDLVRLLPLQYLAYFPAAVFLGKVEPGADLVETLEAAPLGEQGRIYAERGLWYDALAFISAGIDRNPDDARLRELRAGLLEEGGLSGAADFDRRASAQATP